MKGKPNEKLLREAITFDGPTVHADCVKLCQAMGIPPTEKNQELAGDMVREILREKNPAIEAIDTYDL